jgi:hypothetical protein
MGMGENKVVYLPVFPDQLVAKPADAGSGIHDNQVISMQVVSPPYF